jgi:hypothetical protein
MFIGKDSTEANFDKDYNVVYDTSIKVMQQMGGITREDKTTGIIEGKVSSCNINIKIVEKTKGTVSVTITARKYLMPKSNIAGGILYQISEKLK